MMDITRNQVFLAGLVLLFSGIQFRLIDSFDLTPDVTQFLAERSGQPVTTVGAITQSLTQSSAPVVRRNVRPPEWLGWALLSAGSVLILHSFTMKKAGT
jgi:hypothetical protein